MKLENFETYGLSNKVSDKIWKIVSNWNHFEKQTIGIQLTRSADSIAANLAEGYGRYFYKENKQFCYYSRGSLTETICWIEKANKRGLISDLETKSLLNELEIVHIKLNAYIKSIGIENR